MTNEQKFESVFGIDLMDFWSLCDINAEKWAKQEYEETCNLHEGKQ